MSASLDNATLAYTVRRSARARCISIRIDADGSVTLVLPRRADEAAGREFVAHKRRWILRKLAELRSSQLRARDGAEVPTAVPWLGTPLAVHVLAGPAATAARVTRTEDGFVVTVSDAAQVRPALAHWLWRHATARIPHRTLELAARVGVGGVARVQVRNQRRRWGSCSHEGRLSFNWRLIMAPEAVLDYVILHELAHLAHPHHGAAFWHEVARLCPDFRTHRAWLKSEGEALLHEWRT